MSRNRFIRALALLAGMMVIAWFMHCRIGAFFADEFAHTGLVSGVKIVTGD